MNTRWNVLACAFIFCVSAPGSGSALAQGWFIRSSFSPAQTLQTIRFHDSNTGYTVSSLFNGSTFNIHKTTNGGSSWTPQNSGYTSQRFMSIHLFSPDTVLISGNGGIIVKTTNGGTTWVTKPTGVTDQLWSLEFTSATTGYCAGSAGRILKTTDGGESWFGLNSGVINQLYCLRFLNDSVGYVSGSSILLKTTNGGQTWENTNFPSLPPFDQLRQLVFTDSVTAYVIADVGRIRKTTDGGLNWTMLPTGTTNAIFGIDFVNGDTAYACGDHGTIIRTTDAGQNWSPQASGLDEILYGIDVTSPDTGFICSWSGKILKTTNGGATFIRPPDASVPRGVALHQNYPNPFNPVTTIPYTLPAGTRHVVSLQVFDVLGRDVAMLVNEEQGSGDFSVSWDGAHMAGGVYFYRLTAGNHSLMRRMILAK